MPGDAKPEYRYASQARQVLNDAEDDLRDWQPEPDHFDAAGTTGAGGAEEEAKEEAEIKDEVAADEKATAA